MLEQLTPAPWDRIAGYYRMWLETDKSQGFVGWVMRKSKGTVNPSMVMAFSKGWNMRLSGKPQPDLKECDAVRYGYAAADEDCCSGR